LNSQAEYKILISPIGDLDSSLIEHVGKGIAQRFGCPVDILSMLKNVDFALDPTRNQYFSTVILEKLAELAPARAVKILAISDEDLFIPILTHVYGEAQLGGKACIVSTFRLTEALPAINTQKAYYRRVLKEAFHELGHTFNLRHCPDRSCCMHYCRSVDDVDRKSDNFCRYCKILLDDEIKKLANP
jgi:archaemetzincin